jgi:CelD/BcsL family acetyltransferase involved in cellulose biosynthesis
MIEHAPTVRVLAKRAELEAIAADWDALPQAQASPLLSSRWFAAASKLHPDGKLHVVTIRIASRLAAIAPLARTRRNLIDRLEFIGAGVLNEPAALIGEGETAMTSLCDALVALGRPIQLQRVPADSGIEALLRKCARGKGRLIVARSAPCARVDIAGTWSEYLATRSSQARSGMRRKRAMLESNGTVAFDQRRPTPAEVSPAFEEALDVEADGWKGSGRTSMRANAALGKFVAELARQFAETGELRIMFLRAGDRAAAMCVLLEVDHRLWEIKIGYREAARSASPGRLLLWETLRDAFDRGLRSYEFLGSGDSQQPDWATSSMALHTLVYYPYNAAGCIAFAIDAMAHLWRRFRR